MAKAAAIIDPGVVETFNYDLVDVGREVMAHIITKMENNLTAAVARHDKASAVAIGSTLLRAYADLDDLLACSYSFLLGPWIRNAREWAQADAPASYYEWQARSQVSTWWPVPPSARNFSETYQKLPILDNYANKHWNGLVRDFYAKRVLCYVHQINIDMAPAPPAQCTYRAEVANAYLAHYPGSLGTGGGDHPPSVWPGHKRLKY